MPHSLLPLLEELKSDDAEKCEGAAAALQAIADENADAFRDHAVLPLLLDLMDYGPNWTTRETVCRVLDRTAPKEIVARLTQDLVSQEPKTRCDAANRFSRIAEALWPALVRETRKQALPVLLETAASSESGVRSQAIAILGRLRAAAAIPLFIQSLDDENEWVRGDAALALAARGPKADVAVPHLINALGDGATNLYAVIALGKIGASAVPALSRLQELRDTGDDEMNEEAETAIKRIVRLEKARSQRVRQKNPSEGTTP